MRVAVRRINEWDGPAMLKIYAPYVGESPCAPEWELPLLPRYVERIDRYTYGLGWILCEIDSTPAGFCHLMENREDPENLFTVELQLYVKPEFYGRGVGSALWSLMRDIMEYGNRREALARILLPNTAAQGFFTAMGFVDTGRRERTEKGGKAYETGIYRYELSPKNPEAEKPVKPYLIENLDYERAREQAASLVREL